MAGLATVSKIAGETVGQEFLIFTLGDEEYGIDILKVQEIRGYDQVTRIANTPAFIKGVTNLRGVIVPILDLRVKFAQEDVIYNENTVVIVLNFENRVVGIVVDGVSDVLSLSQDQIRPAPEFAVTMSTEYLTGLGSLGDRMLKVKVVGSPPTLAQRPAVARASGLHALFTARCRRHDGHVLSPPRVAQNLVAPRYLLSVFEPPVSKPLRSARFLITPDKIE